MHALLIFAVLDFSLLAIRKGELARVVAGDLTSVSTGVLVPLLSVVVNLPFFALSHAPYTVALSVQLNVEKEQFHRPWVVVGG